MSYDADIIDGKGSLSFVSTSLRRNGRALLVSSIISTCGKVRVSNVENVYSHNNKLGWELAVDSRK